MEKYNPIERTFERLRTELARGLGRPSLLVLIHRDTDLEELVPVERRREVWRHLQAHGLPVPPLARRWPSWAWLLAYLLFPVGVPVLLATQRSAVHLGPGPRTVWELAVYLTRPGDHRDSGHKWTPEEVALKVRMVLADGLGVPVEAVRPETKFTELDRLGRRTVT